MAVGSYDANGIWNFGESDNIAPFSTTLNKLSSSTSSAFTADRARLATLEAGSLAGLIPVKPTTITAVAGTASVNTLGTVTFTNVTSILLEGVFTSVYKNYKVIIKTANTGNGANYYLRMSAAGVEKTTGYYSSVFRFTSAGTSGITADTGGLILGATSSNGNYFACDATIYAPQASERTQISGTADAEENTTANYSFVFGGGTPDNNPYTGVKFYGTTAAGLTGKMTVYGWNN